MAEMIHGQGTPGRPGMLPGSPEHRRLVGATAMLLNDLAELANKHEALVVRYPELNDAMLNVCRVACTITGFDFLSGLAVDTERGRLN